jgi:hypothetical protein
MKKFIYILFLVYLVKPVFSQIGYGTNSPNSSSVIHLYSQDSAKGLIIPLVSSSKLSAPSVLLKGMVVYNLTESCVQYCNGIKWKCLDSLGPAIDSINFGSDTLYVYENNKIIKTRINPTLDTNLVNILTLNKYDTLFQFIADSLLKDDVFLDSLIDKIKDSIDTDIDSVKLMDDTLYIYENGKEIKTVLIQPSSNGNFLVYGNGTFNGEAKVWDASTSNWYATSFGDPVDSVIVSENNFLVYANGTFNGQAKVWDFNSKSWVSTSFGDPVVIGLRDNGNFLVYANGTFNGQAKAWDAVTGSWYATSFGDPITQTIESNHNFLVYANGTFNGQAKVWSFTTKSWIATSFSDPIMDAIAD